MTYYVKKMTYYVKKIITAFGIFYKFKTMEAKI